MGEPPQFPEREGTFGVTFLLVNETYQTKPIAILATLISTPLHWDRRSLPYYPRSSRHISTLWLFETCPAADDRDGGHGKYLRNVTGKGALSREI